MNFQNSETEVKKSVCVWCKGECGVLVHVANGRIIRVEADPEWPRKVYPPTKGCPRLRAAVEWFYHPDRLNFPLKRAGEKGEGKWQKVSWEQALDEIAGSIAKIRDNYGPEAVAYSMGTGYRAEVAPLVRFTSLLGSPNCASPGNICWVPRSRVADAIVGMFPHFSVRPTTRCIVLLGVEPLVSRPIIAPVIRQALKNGAKMIVIDPRRTRSASMADVWLQLRPGTDCALLMGMINVLIQEQLYDKDFVHNWCYGFDKLKKRAEEYPLELVERITGVSADKVRQAALLYAANRPGCMIEGMGIEHLQNAGEVLHARWILAALAGNIDEEGGEELVGPHPHILTAAELEPRAILSPQQRRKQLGEKGKLLTWAGAELILQNQKKVWGKAPAVPTICHEPALMRAILSGKPYPVRAMLVATSNPMVTLPNTKVIYKALKSLDLLAVMDFWMTPTAELADYVLPPASWLERPILWDFHYGNYMMAGEAALPQSIPGEYDHKGDYEFWRELGLRLGQSQYWPWETLEQYYDARLKPTGYTHKEYVHKVRFETKGGKYRKYQEVGFATPTGKVELYSTVYESLGYDPLPRYQEPTETFVSNPELAKEYPLTLITGGRIYEYYHSEGRQIESLRKRHPNPIVQVHPTTANKLGISDGDWVWIETPRGRVRQKAQLFEGMEPNIVHAEHGWWLPELPGEEPWLHGVWEVNINVVIDDDPRICNDVTGAYPLRTALCKVYKVKDY